MKFNLDESLAYIIDLTLRRYRIKLSKALKGHGYNITPYQWVVLYRLWEKEGLSQSQISELTIKDKPTITKMVDVLEKKKLVIRKLDKTDRRKYKIFLTESGRDLKKKLPPIVSEQLQKALSGIDEEEIENTKKVLRKMHNNLL